MRVRLRVLGALFILVAFILVAQLYLVQIVRGEKYARDAVGQYVAPSSREEERGNIFFTARDGSLVAAAVMQRGWRLAIVPAAVRDPDAAYATLSAVTPLDRERFFASAAKKNDPYEEVAFRLDDAQARAVRAKKISGVILAQDEWRFYPGRELAAHAIGFVGYKGDSKTGLYGLERSYQETLAWDTDGRSVNPFAEIFGHLGAAVSLDPTAHQGDIITTIEPSAQRQLEETLDSVMKTYGPRLSGGIVMDPKTGEIVAIAGRPAFDPNAYNLETDPRVFGNPLVEGRYEMGSIMKPLTMAAGIDAGVVSPSTRYTDTGCIEKSGKKVCNYDFKARGVVPMQEVLNQSLNTGVSFVADKMGHGVFVRYMRGYKLGEKTGIDVPGEVAGDISALDYAADVDVASASFGQGVAVSPVEMIRALSALAGGGKLPSPHVVKAIRYESGITRTVSVPGGPQVLKEGTAETVSTMLTTVFDKALLHGELRQEHYSIAAKTGTAQIAIPGGGGYYEDRYLHSFFGYFPSHDPKFIVFLFAVEPHGVQYASASLARPFLDLALFLIHHYEIPPDR